MTQRQDTPVRRLVEDLMTEEGGDTIRLLLERMLNRLPGSRASRATFRHCPVSAQKAVRAYVTAIASLEMVTRLGQLTLRVPRTRDGEFSTSMFRRFQRSERALQLGLVEMYVQGVSTRKVTEVTETLFGTQVSATTISNLSKELDEEIAAWRERPLEEVYPYRAALARLMGALIIEQDERWLSDRRYLNMTLLGERLGKETGKGREAA